MIILDWDNTLFPSTLYYRFYKYPELFSQRARLSDLDAIVASLMKSLLHVDQVTILTNASERWVRNSAQLYLPETFKLFKQLRLISARDLYSQVDQTSESWKFYAVHDVLDLSQESRVLTIGDTIEDRDAIESVLYVNSKICVQSIMLRWNFIAIEQLLDLLVQTQSTALELLSNKFTQRVELTGVNFANLKPHESHPGVSSFVERAIARTRRYQSTSAFSA